MVEHDQHTEGCSTDRPCTLAGVGPAMCVSGVGSQQLIPCAA